MWLQASVIQAEPKINQFRVEFTKKLRHKPPTPNLVPSKALIPSNLKN